MLLYKTPPSQEKNRVLVYFINFLLFKKIKKIVNSLHLLISAVQVVQLSAVVCVSQAIDVIL